MTYEVIENHTVLLDMYLGSEYLEIQEIGEWGRYTRPRDLSTSTKAFNRLGKTGYSMMCREWLKLNSIKHKISTREIFALHSWWDSTDDHYQAMQIRLRFKTDEDRTHFLLANSGWTTVDDIKVGLSWLLGVWHEEPVEDWKDKLPTGPIYIGSC